VTGWFANIPERLAASNFRMKQLTGQWSCRNQLLGSCLKYIVISTVWAPQDQVLAFHAKGLGFWSVNMRDARPALSCKSCLPDTCD